MIFRIFLVCLMIVLSSCGQAGWQGYYTTSSDTTEDKYIAESSDNTTTVILSENNKVDLGLPRDCSGFTFAGIITPFTPPIPIPNFRGLTFKSFMGNKNPCHYFIAETRPQTKTQLKVGDKIYEPKELEGKWGYTKYIFPIRAKNVDSGTLIIEKDGEKIEVPFAYKYYKFWY